MNDQILGLLDGDYTTYVSNDSVETKDDGDRLTFTIELLNSINPSGMLQHRLRLKDKELSDSTESVQIGKAMEQSDLQEPDENVKDMAHSESLELGEIPNSDNEGIYDDIEDFDLGKEVDKLKAENVELEKRIDKLVAAIKKQSADLVDMRKTQQNLENNISSLYNTAKGEIDRKNRQIAELQRELDDIKFRRKRPAGDIQFPPQKRARFGNEQPDNHQESRGHLKRECEAFSTNEEWMRKNDEAGQRHTSLDRADRQSVGMNKERELENGSSNDKSKGSKKQENYEDTRGYKEERYEGQSRKQRMARQNDHDRYGTPDSEDRKSDDSNRLTELENRLGKDRGSNRLSRNWHDDPQEERAYRQRKYGEFNNERRDRYRHDHPKNRIGHRYQMEEDMYGERQYRDGTVGGRERRRDRNIRRDRSRERGYCSDRDRGRSRDRRARLSVRSSSRESRHRNRNDPKGEPTADEKKSIAIEKQPEIIEAKQEDDRSHVQISKIMSRKKLRVVQRLEESMNRSPVKMLQNAKLNTSSDISTVTETHSPMPDEKQILQKQLSDKKILVLSNIVVSDSLDEKSEVIQGATVEKPSAMKGHKEAEDSDELSQIKNYLSVEGMSFCDEKKNKESNKCTNETIAANDSELNSLQAISNSTAANFDTKDKNDSLKKISLDVYKDRNKNSKCEKKRVEDNVGKNNAIKNFSSVEGLRVCDKNKNKVSNNGTTETPVERDSEPNSLQVDPKSTTGGGRKNKTDSLKNTTLNVQKEKNQNSKCEKKHVDNTTEKSNDSIQHFCDKSKDKVSNSGATATDDRKDKTDSSKKITLDVYKGRNHNSKCEKKQVEEMSRKNNDLNGALKTKEDIQRALEADGLIFHSTHSTDVKEISVTNTETEARLKEVSQANEDINRKEASVGLLLLGMKETNIEADRRKTSENIKEGKTKSQSDTVVNRLSENLDTSKEKEAAINLGAKMKDESNSTSDLKANTKKKGIAKQPVTNDLRAKIKCLFDESMDASDVSTNTSSKNIPQNVDTNQELHSTKTNESSAHNKSADLQVEMKQPSFQEIKNGKCKNVDNQSCQKGSSDLANKESRKVEDQKEDSKLRSAAGKKKTAEHDLSSSSQKKSRSKSISQKSESDLESKKQKAKKTDHGDKCDVRKNNKNKTHCTETLKAGFDKLNKQIDAITSSMTGKQKFSEAVAENEMLSNKNTKAETKQKVLKGVSLDENVKIKEKQNGLCSVNQPSENVVVTKNDVQTNPPVKVVEENSDAAECKASFSCLKSASESSGNVAIAKNDRQTNEVIKKSDECKSPLSLNNASKISGSETPKVSENTPENKKIITRKRITPTPVTDMKKPASFGAMLKKCEGPAVAKVVKNLVIEQNLHLTHEGDIPLLHIEENHIDSLPNEDLRNPDSSLMRLIDTMTLSNMECEMPKAHEGSQGKEQEITTRSLSTELTFENLMYKVSSSPVHVTSAKSSDTNDVCNSNVNKINVGDAISTKSDGNCNTNAISTSTNGSVVANATNTSTSTVNDSSGITAETLTSKMFHAARPIANSQTIRGKQHVDVTHTQDRLYPVGPIADLSILFLSRILAACLWTRYGEEP
nr:unnamed protein product [Callosobruchus analis]